MHAHCSQPQNLYTDWSYALAGFRIPRPILAIFHFCFSIRSTELKLITTSNLNVKGYYKTHHYTCSVNDHLEDNTVSLVLTLAPNLCV